MLPENWVTAPLKTSPTPPVQHGRAQRRRGRVRHPLSLHCQCPPSGARMTCPGPAAYAEEWQRLAAELERGEAEAIGYAFMILPGMTLTRTVVGAYHATPRCAGRLEGTGSPYGPTKPAIHAKRRLANFWATAYSKTRSRLPDHPAFAQALPVFHRLKRLPIAVVVLYTLPAKMEEASVVN